MVNKVMLIGNLCEDPSLKYTPSGTAVANFSLATSRKWKDKSGQQQEDTQFHRLVVWDKSAEFCANYLKKGNRAYVEGRIEYRPWEDKDGNKRTSTEIVVSEIRNLSPRDSGQGQQSPEERYASGESTGGDIPF